MIIAWLQTGHYVTGPIWGDDPTGLGQRGGSSTAVQTKDSIVFEVSFDGPAWQFRVMQQAIIQAKAISSSLMHNMQASINSLTPGRFEQNFR